MNVTCVEPAETQKHRFHIESELLRNVLETYGTRIVLIAIGLATTVIAARTLGPVGRGLFAVATAVGAMGVQFGNLGLHASNTYYVARNRALLPVLVGNTLVVGFGFGSLAALCAWIFFVIFPQTAPLQGGILAMALAWIPFGLSYMLLQNLLLGIQEVRAYNGIELTTKVIVLVLFGLVILWGQVSAELMFGSTLAGLALSCMWVLWRLRDHFKAPVSWSLEVFKENLGLGLKAYFISFFGFLVLRTDLLMVKYIAGPEQAGFYSISETMAENILTLPVVIGVILFPKLAGMREQKEKLRLTKNSVLLMSALLLPIMLLAGVFALPLVRLVFGASFVPAVGAFKFMMPGGFFLGIEIVAVQYLNSLGYPFEIVYAWLLVTVLNVTANLWVIPAFGITGAALVSSSSNLLIFLLVMGLIWKSARANTDIEPDAPRVSVAHV